MSGNMNNYLINTFMGLVFYDHEDSWYDPIEGVHLGHPEYDQDWNALMECVEKIEKMDTPDERVFVEIKGGEVFIAVESPRKSGFLFLYQENGYDENDSKLGAVYKAVTAFIQWYNQNK